MYVQEKVCILIVIVEYTSEASNLLHQSWLILQFCCADK